MNDQPQNPINTGVYNMKLEDTKTTSSALEPSGHPPLCWKINIATLVHAFLLVLIGLGTFLLPTLSSAQLPDIQTWQETIKQTQPPQLGCFQASYPDTQWQQVFCAQPQGVVPPWRPPAKSSKAQTMLSSQIGGHGYSASAVGGPIWAAEGSFLSVTNVTSIIDSLSIPSDNTYSLQINTNHFIIPGNSSVCGNDVGCEGWVQFVYQNLTGAEPGDFYGAGVLAIWYWIRNANSCQTSWEATSDGWCIFSYGVHTPLQPISSFNNQIDLSGQTVDGVDSITLAIGGQMYSATTKSRINELPLLWQMAQFNVFGVGNASIAKFNNGSELTINTKIDNGTTNAPDCSDSVGTGESNNLYYNSPCCRYAGGKPSIAFVEGTDDNPNKFACAALGNNTITPEVSSGGGGTIEPSDALQVPTGAVSTFTVTPDLGYNIASVTGCGGSLHGNVFTTVPATVSCTVTATFTNSTNTFTGGAATITLWNGAASLGYWLAVSPPFGFSPDPTSYTYQWQRNSVDIPGATATTSSAAYYQLTAADVGKQISVTVTAHKSGYTDKTVTAPAVTVNPITYTIIATAGVGGTINPSGTITGVAPGTTRTLTVTPNANYYIYQIYGCGGTTVTGDSTFTTPKNYTTGPITASCSIVATFKALPITITAIAGPGGTINPSGTITGVVMGTARTFIVTPNSGYYIASISGCGGVTLTGTTAMIYSRTYTTGTITAPCTVSATFAAFTNPLVTVYEHINRGGTSKTYYQPGLYQTTKGTLGMANDSISSVEVHQPISVTLYDDDYGYAAGGRQIYFPKGFYNLTDYGFNDLTSAISVDSGKTAVIFFEHINEEGQSIAAPRNTNQPNLVAINFNDKASSIFVPSGLTVTLYQDINYGGYSMTLGAGVHNLTKYMMNNTTSWNDQVSSYIVR